MNGYNATPSPYFYLYAKNHNINWTIHDPKWSRPRMKKIIFRTMFSLFLITILGLNFKSSQVEADSKIICVDDNNISGPWDGTPGYPYQNITSGLSHASDGDTILVYNGTYYERLLINNAISLIGQNKDHTAIDGNRTGTVIEVTTDNVSIKGFTIKNCGLFHYTLCGIHLQGIKNANISHNIITTNYKGIYLTDSINNIIANNNVSENLEAIYMVDSNNSIFAGNQLANNEFAMILTNANNNTIFHNNFVNNTQSVSNSVDSTNYWDNDLEGNYWTDYTGRDEDEDGIGETTYTIDTNNHDNCPLIGIFSDFMAIYENEAHHIFTISNSTISQFQFNETLKMIKFNVTGTSNTAGFCRIMIPEKLTHRPHILLIDDKQVNATSLTISNATHTFLYFTYNHSTQEVKILSKPYYELYGIYNALLEKYKNLNSTYHQLVGDYQLLNATYWQLIDDFDTLNQSYWQLSGDYQLVNTTYWQLTGDLDTLNQSALDLQANYNDLLGQYNSLNSTYNKIELEYANTRIILWYISVAATGITIITSSLTIKYLRKSKEQKKLIEKYRSELERLSLLDIARVQFEADVERRRGKIRKFKQKHGITVQPHKTLEDVLKSLELKRKMGD